MKRYSGVAIVFVALITAIGMTYSHYHGRSLEAERELDRVRIAKQYMERVGWVRANPDEKGFRYDSNALFRWYFREVEGHLAKFGGSKAFDEYEAELAKKAKEGDPKLAERKARYEMVRGIFQRMQATEYQPLYTSTQNGTRLDILSATPVTVDGTQKIRWPIAVWGAYRETQEDVKNEIKKVVTSAHFDVHMKLYDAKDKAPYEMSISGEPSFKTDYPERYIWAFPPQILLGYFDVPLVPSDATKAEITFTVDARAPFGGSSQSTYVWKLDVPAAWKLKPGQKWEGAQEEIRPQEASLDKSLTR
jgi:hypothetical protein